MYNAEIYSRTPGDFIQPQAQDVTTTNFVLVIYGAYAESFSSCTVDLVAIGTPAVRPATGR
jgi:hypothetical protein